tara:strand:- start:776 stop:1306 length:531 start_codon:yes stop_codon:yes gene_type:complete
MPLVVPDKINPLSSEFKESYQELIDVVNKVDAAYTDLQRVRAMSMPAPESSGASGISYFVVPIDAPQQVALEVVGHNDLTGMVYERGMLFDVEYGDEELPVKLVRVVTEATGIDLGVTPNHPNDKPPQAEIVGEDALDSGTIVMCQRILDEGNNAVCVFSSIMPRLSVQCSGEETP